jgi:hypothetical protein
MGGSVLLLTKEVVRMTTAQLNKLKDYRVNSGSQLALQVRLGVFRLGVHKSTDVHKFKSSK